MGADDKRRIQNDKHGIFLMMTPPVCCRLCTDGFPLDIHFIVGYLLASGSACLLEVCIQTETAMGVCPRQAASFK
jgi:hypothetical protein